MTDTRREIATVGGGCFWCVEAAFLELRGVEKVVSGYAGGRTANPSYGEVCEGDTGHAEVVQVTFDPSQITYRELLEAFFTVHDPTTLNRQGADVGTQYRSIILFHDAEQERIARELIAELERDDVFGAPIVTEIVPFKEFYSAEQYHQDYYRRNPLQPYCMFVVRPKVAKIRKELASKLRSAMTS
jgi:peptide-methionine (S)-S-oxide reductase